MLDYTRIALAKTVADLKRIAFWFTLIMQLMMVGLPIYSIAVDNGNIYINLLLLAASLVLFVFFIIQSVNESASKAPGKIAKRIYKIIKYISKLYNIGIAVYGVYVAYEHTTLVSLVYLGLMVIGLLISFVLDILIIFFQGRVELIVTAIEADLEIVTKPIGKVQGVIDKVRGKEVEKTEEKPTKTRIYLDAQVSEYRAEKKQKKAEERAERADVWRSRVKSVFTPRSKTEKAEQPREQPEAETMQNK